MHTAARSRPRFRGVSHGYAAVGAACAGAAMVAMTASRRAAAATAVYVLTLALMFTVSAVYHRVSWSPPARARMRRLDHAAIFLIIAGTYTPICLLAMSGAAASRLLALVWAGALAGAALAMLWPRRPAAVKVTPYLALGWLAIAFFDEVSGAVGAGGVALLLAGGVLYTVGAVVYALRRPDPLPSTFGYHEVFHALVIGGSACHFALIEAIVRRGG